jgi:DMSO/TMAO reductase YedYZ heme-binding membrane subunit
MVRVLRHGLLLTLSAAATLLAWYGGDVATARDRASLLTAWLCFAFLLAALSIGPRHAMRTGRPLLNNLVRRDLGIWAALTGLAHLGFATAVVMTPAYFRNYITGPDDAPLPGLAGWAGTASILAGYVIGCLFLLLLALSSDRALRRLGPVRWKRWQRSAYVAFGLSVAHGVVFQFIEQRTGAWLAALLVGTVAVLGLQRLGQRAHLRHEHGR